MSMQVACPGCRLMLLVPTGYAGQALRCPGCRRTFAVRSTTSRALRLGSATSPGKVRERNEDYLLTQQLTWAGQTRRHELALAVVADGMGGHAAGDRAAALAVGGMAKALAFRLASLVAGDETLPSSAGLVELLDFALWEAHRAVSRTAQAEPACAGMGATAVVACVLDDLAVVCHVGDCRAYHLRGGALRCLTRDQTLAQRLVELGQLGEREAASHPTASQVAQALGRQFDLEPSRQSLELATGDVLLLGCDGLHSQLSEDEIRNILSRADEPERAAQSLVEAADAAGGHDNCTVVVVRR